MRRQAEISKKNYEDNYTEKVRNQNKDICLIQKSHMLFTVCSTELLHRLEFCGQDACWGKIEECPNFFPK